MPDLANPSRRHLLAAIGVTGLAAVATPAVDPGLVGRMFATAPGAIPLANGGQSTSRSMRPGDAVLAAAQAGLERVGARVTHKDIVAVADFSRPSSEPRLHLVNVSTGHIDSLLVAHGKGSDPGRSGWLRRFSNVPGSDCTSEGAYLTSEYYVGEHGRSLRLLGLDPTNNNAESRAIVIHPAWYVGPGIVRADGKLGRSNGCFAVNAADASQVLARLGPGRLLIATRLEV